MWEYISISILALVVSLFIFAKNPKGSLHKYYVLFTISIILWLSGVILLRTPESLFELHFRSLFGIASFMSFFLFKFISQLVQREQSVRVDVFILVMNLLVTVLTLFSPLITSEVTRSSTEIMPERGPLYVLASLWVFGLGVISIALLILKLRQKNLAKDKRRQLNVVLLALVLAVATAATTNIILPVATNNTAYSNFAPLALLFLSFGLGYAIVRHGLLDIRATVARSVVYLASIASILLVYLAIIFGLSGTNILASNLTTLQRVSFAAIAVLSGFLFQPFKNFFDKVTSRLFYRDAYDAQALIDELNNTLVNNVELESLLTKSALVIQENLKTSFCTFYIRKTAYFDDRIIGAHRRTPEYEGIDDLHEYSSKIKHKVHSVDVVSDREEGNKLREVMRKNDIDVLARLVSTLDYDVKGIGYIFLGNKRSGSPYSKQDLKILEIIANELVIAIENVLRFEEIEQFNVTLQKKIDAATRELKQSNDKLKALDEAKDEFVSMASHQLRTPLTSIKGYLSMVLEGDAGKVSETQEKMLGQAFFSSQRMVYLISDLLNVSRLKTGKFLIEPKPVYLPDVVEDELNQLYEGARAKNLTLSFKKPTEFPTLSLDEFKIRQVVMNFTDNAIYYTPSGGKITVELKDSGKMVEFTIKDSGIGVPKEEQHKLFTKFYRANNARKARPDGTGLGLFMAKKVIVAQGGSLIFESKEGKGSTFGFSFPKEKLEINTKVHEADEPKDPGTVDKD